MSKLLESDAADSVVADGQRLRADEERAASDPGVTACRPRQAPGSGGENRAYVTLFGVAVFLGAFLLFQVQPLIGKFILPWFGSSPGVWAACLLFFQVTLLGGYAYAHLLVSKLSPTRQAWTHVCLLVIALATMPITPSDSWRPGPEQNPVLGILGVLGASVGVPFLLLSATGPLLQRWFAHLEPGRSPYRLYALSNVGSIVALISYPFVVERFVSLHGQTAGWSWLYGGFALLMGACAWRLLRRARTDERIGREEVNAPAASRSDVALWMLLSACGSAMLLATTNQLLMDVAAVPFLWVLPLVVYLVSFILCFESERWYVRPLFCALLPVALLLAADLIEHGVDVGIVHQVLGYAGSLFVCCMCCHGELARRRPAARQLTHFFLSVAAGGAIGGLFVALVAPMIFSDIHEYPLLLAATLILTLVAATQSVLKSETAPDRKRGRILAAMGWVACASTLLWVAGRFLIDRSWIDGGSAAMRAGLAWQSYGRYVAVVVVIGLVLRVEWPRVWHGVSVSAWWSSPPRLRAVGFGIAACLGVVSLLGMLAWPVFGDGTEQPFRKDRNFYGVLSIEERERATDDERYVLNHGRIIHGSQYSNYAGWPTTYYGYDSGVGLAIQRHPSRMVDGRQFRFGVIGLGAGTVAAYANAIVDPEQEEEDVSLLPRLPGDLVNFYEINPMVRDWAEEHFTFLEDARSRGADVDVLMGDARIVMERQLEEGQSQQFDVLVIDAFSGDAIPIHLLTIEAMEVYWRHLRADGILAVNVTNRFVDLAPVVLRLGQRLQISAIRIEGEEDQEYGLQDSAWMLLTNNRGFLADEVIAEAVTDMPVSGPLWTDDFSSLFEVLSTDG